MIIYWSGSETAINAYGVDPPVTQSLFVSFFYYRKSTVTLHTVGQLASIAEPLTKRGWRVVDSGAFTYLAAAGIGIHREKGTKQQIKTEGFDKYLLGYLEWLRRTERYWDFFVELDLQEIEGIGRGRVDKWRQQIIDAGMWHRCIPVLHKSESQAEMQETIELCKAGSRYIAIEGPTGAGSVYPYDYRPLLKQFWHEKLLPHVFGCTKPAMADKFPIFSLDASSANAAVQYGKGCVFDAKTGKMRWYVLSAQNLRKAGIPDYMNKDARDSETYKRKFEHQLDQYAAYEKYYTKLWGQRGIIWDDHIEAVSDAANRPIHPRAG